MPSDENPAVEPDMVLAHHVVEFVHDLPTYTVYVCTKPYCGKGPWEEMDDAMAHTNESGGEHSITGQEMYRNPFVSLAEMLRQDDFEDTDVLDALESAYEQYRCTEAAKPDPKDILAAGIRAGIRDPDDLPPEYALPDDFEMPADRREFEWPDDDGWEAPDAE